MNRRFLLAVVVATLTVGSSPTQEVGDSQLPATNITIRLLNGKTGKRIKNEEPNIYIGSQWLSEHFPHPRADSNGEIIVDVAQAKPRTVTVSGNIYADCQLKNQTIRNFPAYSLDEVVSTGVVSKNFCGKHNATPTPGLLIIYLRPMTLLEKFAL